VVQRDPALNEAQAAFRRGDLARARVIAEARLTSEPGSAVLQHLLGLIHCREGRLDAGVERLGHAVEAEPDNPAYRVMLVRALNDSGRHEEALARALPPAGTSPAELALWHARAEAAQALGRHGEAADAWKLLCAARPDDWRSWANYGDALAGLDRWPDAADALRRAWTLNPGERPLQQSFASALARAGFFDEAADQLKSMLDAGPEDTGIRLMLSRLLADLGRHEDSMAELDQAARHAVGDDASGEGDRGLIRIALGARHDTSGPIAEADVRAVRELALLLERTNRMDALRTLLDDAEAAGISREDLAYPAAAIALRDGDAAEARRLLALENPDSDPVRQHRLLAKILDALGDADGAFAAAEGMNRSVADFDGWIRRGSDYRRRLRIFADTVTPEWAAQLQPLRPSDRRSPAFLVGFPRSGTTLLDTFLMGHPDTEVLEEFHMLGAAETVLGNVAGLPHRSAEQLEQARRAYFAELDRHADRGFGGLVIDKLPLNMLGLPVIHSLFPDAKIIFAQRHPCDVVLSGFMQSFTLNDAMACFLTIVDAADLYDSAMSLFTRSRDALQVGVHTLVYEELVADPAAALQPLIAFLGLDWRPELLDHRATAKARGTIITPSYDQVVQPLSKAPSGRWRRYEAQLEPVLPVLMPWAERLGYSSG
jgi:tetratricopeptide (TPR) repeat protein